MTMPQSLIEQIHDRVGRVLEGSADDADRAALEQLVASSPEARSAYISFMEDTALLRWRSATRQPNVAAELLELTPGEVSRRRWSGAVPWAAAVMVAILGVVAWRTAPMSRPTAAVVKPTSVATLIRATNVAWPSDGTSWPELTRLARGDVLRFDAGEVELVFDTGVEVIVRGPADFEICGGDRAFSRLGKISARVGVDGEGFTIETPVARVVDLGTEFAIEVTSSGLTDVAVLQGRVDLAVNGSNGDGHETEARRLEQGEGLRVEPGGKVGRVMAISSDQFPDGSRSDRRPRDAEPIITAISDNSPSETVSKFYRIIRGGLSEDAPAFVDRNHEWNGVDSLGIPPCLDNAEYVMTFNDDKFVDGFQMAVEVSRPATLYVLMSDQVRVPEWLRADFVDTGMKIGLDEGPNRFKPRLETGVGTGQSIDTTFSVWCRVVPTPSTVMLGGVVPSADLEGYNMYGVAVVALPE